MSSRRIDDLNVELQIKFHQFRIAADAAGVQFMVTSTYRSQEEQDELYSQGRTKPGKIVTWTKSSKHTERKAFDVAVLNENNQPTWNLKADVDKDSVPDYEELGRIGEHFGLTWGGSWKKKDYCHFELNEEEI
jgi:peptidoglycan LD-endopeptidase CwlK